MKLKGFLFILMPLLIGCNPESDAVKQAETINLTPQQAERVVQDNDFALDLFKKTIASSTESNVFISPLSVSMSLGMLWNGANGATKSEIENALKMNGLNIDDINNYYKLMQTTLPKIDPLTKLTIANSIWYRDILPLKPDFLKTNTDYFNAKVAALDFGNSKSVDIINNWCSDNTNKLIPKVIDEIEPNAMMFLINALYFKGTWVKKFDKRKTNEENFTTDQNRQVKVNMMHIEEKFKYTEDEMAQYLEMSYGNKAFSMLILLPLDSKSTEDVLNNLSPERLTQVLSTMYSPKANVRLPRFQVKSSFQLKLMLQAMGMQQVFTENADLTNISDWKPLYVKYVKHDTYVKVDEEGTEAAAVTKTSLFTKSEEPIIPFTVNKPFVFLIRENSTGVILFMGKMGDVEKF